MLVRPFGQARTFLRRGEPVPAPDPNAPQKCSLLVVPLFHTTGCHAAMVPSLAAGVKLVLMHKWEPELAMQLIERERVTNAGGVPTIAWQLLEHPALGKYDLSSLEKHLLRWRAGRRRSGRAAEGEIPQGGSRHRLGHDRGFGRNSPDIRPRITNTARRAAAPPFRSAR